MAHNDSISEEIKERFAENEEIVREVRADIDLLTEVRYRILKRKLHRQLMELAQDAVDNEKIQINSVDDLCTLAELSLFLL